MKIFFVRKEEPRSTFQNQPAPFASTLFVSVPALVAVHFYGKGLKESRRSWNKGARRGPRNEVNLSRRKKVRVQWRDIQSFDAPATFKRNGFTVRQSWKSMGTVRGENGGGYRESRLLVEGLRSDGAITPLISLRQPC